MFGRRPAAMDELDRTIEEAARVLVSARYAVALVGAGISVESGIPPFRGVGGLWTKHGEPPMDGYTRFLEDPAKGWRDMLARRETDDEFARTIREAAPNPSHLALADLESMGVLKHTITQNIDNLHFDAGSRAVTEIHGNRTKARCIACGERWRFDEIDVSQLPPLCARCGGVVKSDTVMFGEPIPQEALAECYRQAERADCMLIAGTSAAVVPAAWFPSIVSENGGALVEVNIEPTPYTATATASIRAPAGEALPKLAEAVRRQRAGSPRD
jgi:NAD-dependent deacetylase